MAASSALSRTLDLVRLRDDDVTWRLLRADNAHLIVGILGAHLGGEQRRLDAADLYERVDADLDQLRDYGLDLPRNGQGYCSDWRSAGFLIRRPTEDARGETFELSAGALAAIRTLDALAAPRQAATESRLAAIAAQLGQLALDTDPDATRRLEQLHARRAEIDAEIERVHAGEVDPLDDTRALERIRDILMQSEEMPSDFARVRAQFEELNRMLRQRILESDDSQKHVLDEVFRGVDLIAESDEGRSFAGFSALILDRARPARARRQPRVLPGGQGTRTDRPGTRRDEKPQEQPAGRPVAGPAAAGRRPGHQRIGAPVRRRTDRGAARLRRLDRRHRAGALPDRLRAAGAR